MTLFNRKLLKIAFKMNETQRFIERQKFISLVNLEGLSEVNSLSSLPLGIFVRGGDLIVLDKRHISIYEDQVKGFVRKQILEYSDKHAANAQFYPMFVQATFER